MVNGQTELNSALPANQWRQVENVLGIVGLAGFLASIHLMRHLQFNIANYTATPAPGPVGWATWTLPAVTASLFVIWCALGARHAGSIAAAISGFAPLCLTLPLVMIALASAPSAFGWSLLVIAAAGLAAFRLGTMADNGNGKSRDMGHDSANQIDSPPDEVGSKGDGLRSAAFAVGSLLVGIALLTWIHTRLQIQFFEHFMLGHADFGHYTEELKNALAGRGLRSDSFENTRMGWHFVPLMYALVPGYWLWPSPVFLMVCGPIINYLAALPVYFFARRHGGSVWVAWMFAVAWLFLPSNSRMVYSNTYGFQWICACMPLIACMVAWGPSPYATRQRTVHHIAAIILLLMVQETTAVAVFGWGLYVALFTRQRFLGAFIAAASVVYLVLCVKLFIPHFAAAGRYERMDLYGSLGGSLVELVMSPFRNPGLWYERLFRREAWYFVAVLIITLGGLPLFGWRLALAAGPTMLGILLMANGEWLSIKFWHQSAVLPFLFMAGIAALAPGKNVVNQGAVPPDRSPRRKPSEASRRRAWAAAALASAMMGHYFFGFSPLAKSYEVFARDPSLHAPDPRLPFVRDFRARVPKEASIHATERLAAHFTDYQRIYTGAKPRQADYVIIDRGDAWDRSGLAQSAPAFQADPRYAVESEAGDLIVFRRVQE